MALFRELRIGSFVFAVGKERAVSSLVGAGNPVAFKESDIDVYFDYEVGIGTIGCKITQIKPIGISTELLGKMGFVEQRKNYFVLFIKRHELASALNGWRYAYQVRGKKFSFQGGWIDHHKIESAHRLQNYIFETSGHFITL